MLCPPFHFKEEYIEREKKKKMSSVVIKLNQKKTENEGERKNK